MRLWDAFVSSHPEATPFHLSSWIRTLRDTYRFEPKLLVCTDDSKKITGLLPYFIVKNFLSGPRIISMPFSDYSYPLTCGAVVEKRLLKRIKEVAGIKSIEIRGPIADTEYKYHDNFKRYILALDPDPSVTYAGFNKSTIVRSIKKAEKNGIEIIEDNSPAGIDAFFQLNRATRKRHGVPHQSRLFFDNIAKNLFSKKYGYILHARQKKTSISATLFLRFNGTLYYKYNATDPKYMRKLTSNHLLVWHAIQKAANDGDHTLDFGRTSTENLGLVRYKTMWGAKAYEYRYYYYPALSGAGAQDESSLPYRLVTGIWRRLPYGITDRLSSTLMKWLA